MSEAWTRAVVALGTNQGDRHLTLEHAIADLRATEGVRVVAVSPVVETVALTESGFDDTAPPYLNQVVIVDTAWPAEHFLGQLHLIENRHGRHRDGTRYAPRTLDLDIITYSDDTVDIPGLTIPHPRAHERAFVLTPWLAVDPEAFIPGRGSVREILRELDAGA